MICSVCCDWWTAAMRWTVCIDGGPRRVNHAAVAIGENIYSFGGYCTGEDYAVKRPMDVFVFNTGEQTFRLGAHLDSWGSAKENLDLFRDQCFS